MDPSGPTNWPGFSAGVDDPQVGGRNRPATGPFPLRSPTAQGTSCAVPSLPL
jgi:hypothetical protein